MEKTQQQVPYQKETEEVLIEFNKALRAINFYPPGHAALKPILKRGYEILMKYLFALNELSLIIKKDGFYFRELPLGRQHSAIHGLAQEFFLRRVKMLKIMKEITPREFTIVLKMLVVNPDELQTKGGAERFIFSRGVRSVILNEVHYEKFRLEEEASLDEGDLLESGEEEEVQEEIIPLGFELTDEEEEVIKILNQMEAQKEAWAYIQLLKMIIPRIRALLLQGKTEVAFRAMTSLSRHYLEPRRPKEIKPSITEGLRSIADDRTIPLIVGRLCSNEVTEPSDIINLIFIIGEVMLTNLILRLSLERDMRFRRRLSMAIVRFKGKALPRLIPFLNDNRWFVVRNVVAILGEIRLPESVPYLSNILNYPDDRVKKEIIKTLSKIRTRESIEILLMLLFSSTPELRGYAAYSLGMVRETFAVPYFIKILKGRSLYFEDINFLKEVILALGKIGTGECLAPLLRVFKKRPVFFRKRFRFLKGIVSQALGDMAGEDSVTLLFDCAIREKGDLRNTCFNVLSQIAERFEIV